MRQVRRQRRPSRLGQALTRLASLPWVSAALLLALLMGADSDAGRDLLARALTAATGGQVMIRGLGGELPFRPHIDRLALADADGVWLRATDVSLELRPASLVRGELDILALTTDELAVARLPKTGAGDGAGFHLPLPVRLRRLVVARLVHSAPESPLPALAATGSALFAGADIDADVLLSVPGRDDRYRLTLTPAPRGHRLSVAVSEAADGPLAALASAAGVPRPPGFGDWTLSARLQGPLTAVAVDAELASGPYRAGVDGIIDLSARGIPALDARVELAVMTVQPPVEQAGLAWERLVADIEVQGRVQWEPTARQGQLVLSGRWRGEPVAVDLALGPMAVGGLDLRIRDGRWSGITLGGRLRLASDARLPTGDLIIGIPRLDAAAPLLMPMLAARLPPAGAADWSSRFGGRLDVRLELAGEDRIGIVGDGAALRLPGGVTVARLALDGALHDPLGEARGDLQLRLADLASAGVGGELEFRARGPVDALDIGAAARLRFAPPSVASATDLRLALAGLLRPPARRLELDSLRVDAGDRRVTLLGPAAVDFGTGVRLETLRLGLSPGPQASSGTGPAGVLELSGQVAPRLSLDGRLAGLELATISPWLPSALSGLRGVLDAEARLAGSAAAPTGRVSLDTRGLVLAGAERLGLPPAAGRLTLTLEDAAARLSAEVGLAERARLMLDGRIGGRPWRASAPLDLRARGHLELPLLDGWLSAGGRRAEGRVGLDLVITGTGAAPRLDGRLDVADGAWRDRRLGIWLDDIVGSARLREDRLRIERLAARSGPGTLSLAGDIDRLASERTLDLRLRARGAEPIQLDLLRLRGDADLTLAGRLARDLSLTGDMRFDEVDIRIPEQLPADIPTLDVVERGERRQPRPPRRAAARSALTGRLQLDVRVDAPRAVLVRGRNIDAEFGGRVHLRGSAAAPAAEGDFALLRGEYALIGQPLRFTGGRIGLDGADLLDPTLDFEARTQDAGATAILAVTGRARAPEVVLRGEPPMSDDEVLSRLLFGVPPNRLSAFQLTRLGLAAASITGVGGDGSGLLQRARAGLGLSRLRIDGDRRGGTALEGGRQLTERVYLGARQTLEGGDPRAVLGLQVAPRIRFESDVGSRGAGAGAAFELEY
jgi:translocation and assembly module TamB